MIFQFINRGDITRYEINPEELGIPLSNLGNLKGGSPEENGQTILRILRNEKGPKRDIVLLNAAAGIMVGGKATSLKEGYSLAEESVDSLSALNVLKGIQK